MNKTPKIFVDGQEGTTGLKIHEYLAVRNDIEIVHISSDKRKDAGERQRLLNAADVAILCLPDVASREAVALITNPETRVIDASTAFRTDPAWAYGLPELNAGQRAKIRTAKRVAVPGCHASAFILSVAPLIAAGAIPMDVPLTCFSITGYSGGGKKMIAAYEQNPAPKLKAPRHYALNFQHKHLPEMQKIPGLTHPPMFTPVVCNIHSGLAVETFLPATLLGSLDLPIDAPTPQEIHQLLTNHYQGEKFIRVMPLDLEARGLGGPEGVDEGGIDITACNNTNRADIFVFGNKEQMAIITRLDNLGKGAAGAAIQCLNLMLGAEESAGLRAEVA